MGLLLKSESRRLSFIFYLEQQVVPISIEKLAKVLETNEETIRTDIEWINCYVEDVEIISDDLGYRLVFNSNGTFQSVNSYFIMNNLNFSILLYIFHHDSCTIQEIADDLFSSVATISRNIITINESFEEYNINFKVTTNPVKFDGDEREIRYFFLRLLMEVNELHEPIFYDFIDAIAPMIAWANDEIVMGDYSIGDLKDLRMVFYTNFLRVSQGYKCGASQFQPFTKELVDHPAFAKLCDFSYKYAKPENLEEFVGELLYPYSLSPAKYYINAPSKFKLDIEHSFIEESLDHLLAIIDKLSQKFEIKIKQPQVLATILHNISVNFLTYGRYYYFLLDRLAPLRRVIEEVHAPFNDACYELLANYSKFLLGEENSELIYQLIEIIFVSWEDLIFQLNKYHYPIRTLIINSVSREQARFLRNMLDYDHCDQLVIDVWEDAFDRLSREVLNTYDLVISDHFSDLLLVEVNPICLMINSQTYTVELGFSVRQAINRIRKQRIDEFYQEFNKNK